MKILLSALLMLLLLSGSSGALTVPQAQANALNCIEMVKFAAELSSPSLNNFMLSSKKIVYDKQSGTVFIMEKAIGDIQFKYFDKNKKAITGKTVSELYNNAFKNAAYFEVTISNKLLYNGKFTVTYDSPLKKHENLSVTGALSVISGKDTVSYKFTEKVKIAELSTTKTVISGGTLRSEGAFKDLIVIDFTKNHLKSNADKKAQNNPFNSDKRSQKIDNLKYSLSK